MRSLGTWIRSTSVVGLVVIVATAVAHLRDTRPTAVSARQKLAPTTTPSQPLYSSRSITQLRVVDQQGIAHAVVVYRPRAMAGALLPVLYFLHGYPGSATSAMTAGLPDCLDRVFAAGTTTPFEVVFPDGTSRSHPDSEWADSADGRQRIETFITGPLIAAVEPVRRPRGMRAIAGFSMGGYGAINIAEHHPQIYGQVVSLAGYFKIDDPDGVFAQDPVVQQVNDPSRNFESLRSMRVALLQGADDESLPEAGELERFSTLLDRAGIAHAAARTPGSHSWRWVNGQLPRVAAFLDAGWEDQSGTDGHS
jgi:S-formylglutathione hydrolase FrmB